jgi:DNA-binding response OmpR family regulator
MNLQSLLVCSDDRTLRVLRKVLGELEIGVEHCADPAGATKKLARQNFEAVIVDCEDERSFSLLKSVRRAQHNKKALAVAIVDEHTGCTAHLRWGLTSWSTSRFPASGPSRVSEQPELS